MFLIIVLSIINSCTKRDSEIIKTPNNFVYAGVTDDLSYTDYVPDIVIKGTRNGNVTNYLYNDSITIDLNNDNIDDLQFTYYKKFESFECLPPLDCMPEAERKLSIKTLSNLEIACDSIIAPYYSIFLPICFQINDTINNAKIWRGQNIMFLRRDNFSELNGAGYWYEKIDRYIGFRIKQDNNTIYGWIQLDTKNDCILLDNFAIEK